MLFELSRELLYKIGQFQRKITFICNIVELLVKKQLIYIGFYFSKKDKILPIGSKILRENIKDSW